MKFNKIKPSYGGKLFRINACAGSCVVQRQQVYHIFSTHPPIPKNKFHVLIERHYTKIVSGCGSH